MGLRVHRVRAMSDQPCTPYSKPVDSLHEGAIMAHDLVRRGCRATYGKARVIKHDVKGHPFWATAIVVTWWPS